MADLLQVKCGTAYLAKGVKKWDSLKIIQMSLTG